MVNAPRRNAVAVRVVASALLAVALGAGAVEPLIEQVAEMPCDKSLERLNGEMASGNAEAFAIAGLFFERGICVKEDVKRAALLYQQGSDRGSRSAAEGLAFLFAAGRGVEQDYGSAGALLRPAGSPSDDVITGSDYTRGYAFAIVRQAIRELAAQKPATGFDYVSLIPREMMVRFDTSDPSRTVTLPDYHDTTTAAQAVAQRATIRAVVAEAISRSTRQLPAFDAARYPPATFQFRMVRLHDRFSRLHDWITESFAAHVDRFESVAP